MPVTVNTVAWDFSNLEVQVELLNKLSNVDVRTLGNIGVATGLTEINYTSTIERADMTGSARQAQDETDGLATYEASISLELYWWRYFLAKAREAQVGWANLRMNVQVVMFKPGIAPEVDTIYRASIASSERAFAKGPDSLVVPVELKPFRIFEQGVDPFGNSIFT
jgi:hypothetical protein